MNDRHAEGSGALRHRLPMRPEPDDAELPAAQLHAEQLVERPSLPVAAPQHPLAFAQPAGHGQDQRQREIGRGIRQDVRRVGDDDAPLTRGGDVDVVVADGDVGDDAQSLARFDHRPIDGVGDHRQQRLLAGDAAHQLVVRRRRRVASMRSTSHAASRRVMTDAGSLRVRRTGGLVAVGLAVAAVIAHHRGLDDAGAVGVGAGRHGEHPVAWRGGERPPGPARERCARSRRLDTVPGDRAHGRAAPVVKLLPSPLRACEAGTSTVSMMPTTAASTGASLRPSASPAARPSMTIRTFSCTPAPSASTARIAVPRGCRRASAAARASSLAPSNVACFWVATTVPTTRPICMLAVRLKPDTTLRSMPLL